MGYEEVAMQVANSFTTRMKSGEEGAEGQPIDLHEQIKRTDFSTIEDLRAICLKVQELLGGKGARDPLDRLFICDVWADLYVGTCESEDDEIDVILCLESGDPLHP